MITETQVQIQVAAAVESLVSDIDTLAVLDRQLKDLTERVKNLKDSIANAYGVGKHRGEKYGVTISLADVKGAVNNKAVYKHYGITDADLEAFRGESIARITVTPTV
jgi:hypothetical protein